MSSSPDDEPLSLEENGHLLASFSYPMDVLRSSNPRYRDGVEDANTGQTSPLLSSDASEIGVAQVQEDGFLTARLKSIYSHHGGPKRLGARISRAFCQWTKGPRTPRPFEIKTIMPQLQTAPPALLHKHFPGQRGKLSLLIILCLLWVVVFLTVLYISISRCQIPGYTTPIRLSCVSKFW